MKQLVIRNIAGKFLGFSGWVSEFPDAQKFKSVAKAATRALALPDTRVEIVADYGMESAKTVWSHLMP